MEDIKQSLDLYVMSRVAPGGFLMACLENNLCEALGRADHVNQGRIHEIVSYIYNEIPSDCWGSPEKVNIWLNEETEASK